LHLLNLRLGCDLSPESLLIRMRCEIDEDEGAKRKVYPVGVEHSVIAANHAGAVQPTHTFVGG
jgi:hypothetical protein